MSDAVVDGNDASVMAAGKARLNLRCYAPRIGTIVGVVLLCLMMFHGAASHALATVGLVAAVAAATIGVAVIAAVLFYTSRAIKRRRAAAGACTTCRFHCKQALPAMRSPRLVVRYDLDAPEQTPARELATATVAAPAKPAAVRELAATAAAATPEPVAVREVAAAEGTAAAERIAAAESRQPAAHGAPSQAPMRWPHWPHPPEPARVLHPAGRSAGAQSMKTARELVPAGDGRP